MHGKYPSCTEVRLWSGREKGRTDKRRTLTNRTRRLTADLRLCTAVTLCLAHPGPPDPSSNSGTVVANRTNHEAAHPDGLM